MNSRPAPLYLSGLAFGLALYAGWVLIHIGADPAFRTIFIEEYHSGEAGRSFHLFGSWIGEGGGWQSLPFAPLASLLTALSYSVLGHNLTALRAPFVLLSLASIVIFALVCQRAAPRYPWLVVGAVLVFALSPFLTVLRPTSINENLYPFVAALVLFILLRIDEADTSKKRLWLYGIAGLVTGSALLVKVDGIALPLALAITMAVELWAGRIRFIDFVACGIGGFASGLLLVGLVFATMGPKEAIDAIAYSKAIMDYRAPRMPHGILNQLTASCLALPKNLDVYFPGQSFLLIPGIALALQAYGRLSLAARFCLVVMLTLFVWSCFAPLMYWKKVTIVAVPLVFLHLSVVKDMLDNRDKVPVKSLVYILFGSSLLALAVAASKFYGMTRVIPFWSVKPWHIPEVWATLAGAAVLLLLIRRVELRRLMLGLYATVAGLIAVCGLYRIVSFPPRYDAEKVGELIAAKIGQSDVVSDHNGYRFASAFSNSHFRFFHENDPLFPAGITSEARKTHAPFVLVTNTYTPLEKQIDKDLPEYRKILRLKYVHPFGSFSEHNTANEIILYERNVDRALPSPAASVLR